MLGADLAETSAAAGHDVIATSRETLDVTSLEGVQHAVTSMRPDCVVHCAAVTNVEECERNPELAYSANTLATWNVALACARADIPIVYVSSCGVFDGTKADLYTEFDTPAPRTHHHRSKFLGEQHVATHCRKHFIVRPGWLFGGSVVHKKNFVAARRREALANPVMVSAKDRFGSPTYTVDFANQVLHLIASEAYGTYHVVNLGLASRFEYVSEVIRTLSLPNEVKPVASDFFPRGAPVPVWEALDNTCLRMRGLLLMRPWQEALAEYVSHRFLPEIRGMEQT